MATTSEALPLAMQYFRSGLVREAELLCNKIVELEPANDGAWCLLGMIALKQGESSRALEFSERAIRLNRVLPEAHHGLGLALRGLGRVDEAIRAFQTAISLSPVFAAAYDSLGGAFKQQGRMAESIVCYRHALKLEPHSPETLSNLGLALLDEDLDEAIACCRRAVQLPPDFPQKYSNLGVALLRAGELDEAIALFEQALRLNPNYAEACSNLGDAYGHKGDLARFDEWYDRALAISPEFPHARAARAMRMLQKGDFEHGWPEYEYRWKTAKLVPRPFAQPRWKDESLVGKSILLHAEQGLGDTIQFIRYAQLVKALGATVIVECYKPLTKLLASGTGIDQVYATGNGIPQSDFHVPLLSLPAHFKTAVDNVPANVPYLFADSKLVAHWREKLDPFTGFRVGINWHGREGKGLWQKRDIPLGLFDSLAEIPEVRLISLQKGTGRYELLSMCDSTSIIDLGEDVDTFNGGFMDTAAIMMNLDLVISSDTAVPHLAGALGVPVWVALPAESSWQWLLGRNTSPWYPTMRLFRQKQAGDWPTVFHEIRDGLRKCIRTRAE